MEFYVTFERAVELITSQEFTLPSQQVSLFEATGRVLREDVVADRDDPPVPVSAMDGYGVKFPDVESIPSRLKVKGAVPAGVDRPVEIERGETVKLFTGSVVPESVDLVVPVEWTEEREGWVEVKKSFPKGANVRPPGENYRKGQVLIKEGTVLGAPEIGIAASVGRSFLKVSVKPRVGIVVTGSELLEPWEGFSSPVQIRNANAYTLYSLVREAGGEPVYFGIVEDSREKTLNALSEALEVCDVVITSGGVSAGDYDFVKEVVGELGIDVLFYKVQVKPGKPVLFGRKGNKFLFGLPGFPVSVFTSFNLFVYPLLMKIQKAKEIFKPRVRGVLVEDYSRKKAERTEFVRCSFTFSEDRFLVSPLKRQGSGILSALIGRRALMVVPKGVKSLRKGDSVDLILVKGL